MKLVPEWSPGDPGRPVDIPVRVGGDQAVIAATVTAGRGWVRITLAAGDETAEAALRHLFDTARSVA